MKVLSRIENPVQVGPVYRADAWWDASLHGGGHQAGSE